MWELAEEYRKQLDYLELKIKELQRTAVPGEKEYSTLLQYKAMYDDVLYSYRQIMKYINA